MFAQWVIGIRLVATSNFGLVARQASAQSAAAQKSMTGLKSQMSGVAAAGKMLDRALIGVGIGSAAFFAMGIKGASDLQNATLQSAIAMGRMGNSIDQTMDRMKDFRSVALDMSKMTGQSMADSMTVVARMASAGLSGDQIKSASKPIAQFGDILKMGKDNMSYEDSAVLGSGIVHELRLFSPKDVAYGLGEIGQLGHLSPHGTAALATQLRIGGQQLENILPGDSRSKADQIMTLTAWADRMGGLQRFGAGIQQLTTQMIQPRSDRVYEALVDLGIMSNPVRGKHGKIVGAHNNFWDAHAGQLDIVGALKEAAAHWQKAINLPGGRGQAVIDMLGLPANAARNFQLFANADSLKALANVERQHAAMGDPVAWMAATQAQLMGTLSGQTLILTSNFKTLATLIGERFIGPLTKIVNWLQLKVGKANSFLMDHPDTAKAIGVGMLATIGYAAARLAMMGASGIRLIGSLSKHYHESSAVAHLLEDGGGKTGIMGKMGARLAIGGSEGLLATLFGLNESKKLLSEIGRATKLTPWLASVRAGAGNAVRGFGQNILASDEFKAFAEAAKPFVKMLRFFPDLFSRIGLRFIPFVGEVLLVIDALNFLRTHMQDLGFYVGKLGIWLGANLPGAISFAAGLAVDAMKALVTEIIGVLNPMNWVTAISDFKQGVNDAVHGLSEDQKAKMRMKVGLQLPPPVPVGPTVQHFNITVKADTRAGGVAAGQGLLETLRGTAGSIFTTPTGGPRLTNVPQRKH